MRRGPPLTYRGAFQLISVEEAALPPGPVMRLRGNIPGPIIEVLSPLDDADIQSPVRFVVRFKSYARSKIDVESVRGARIGITANSHKVIRNRLDEVLKEAEGSPQGIGAGG